MTMACPAGEEPTPTPDCMVDCAPIQPVLAPLPQQRLVVRRNQFAPAIADPDGRHHGRALALRITSRPARGSDYWKTYGMLAIRPMVTARNDHNDGDTLTVWTTIRKCSTDISETNQFNAARGNGDRADWTLRCQRSRAHTWRASIQTHSWVYTTRKANGVQLRNIRDYRPRATAW